MSVDLQAAPPQTAEPTGPDLGVIEEARERRRARRRAIGISVTILAAAAGIAGALLSGGPPNRSRARVARESRGVALARGAVPSREARIAPALTGGSYGWSVIAAGGGSCCTVPVRGNPLAAETTASTKSGREVATFLSGPELSTVLFDGRRLPTRIFQLPFGLRLVQVTITHPAGSRSAGTPLPGPAVRLTALDGQGHVLAKSRLFDGPPVRSRWWKRGQRQPGGPCGLQAHGLAGLTAEWGHVASAILPFGAPIAGRAFFSCIDTEYYLRRWPLDAAILLDAQRPGSRPAPIPGMKPVTGAPGYFDAPPEWRGAVTARRTGTFWLLVAGGDGEAQRLELLRHLTATVTLPRRDAAAHR